MLFSSGENEYTTLLYFSSTLNFIFSYFFVKKIVIYFFSFFAGREGGLCSRWHEGFFFQLSVWLLI